MPAEGFRSDEDKCGRSVFPFSTEPSVIALCYYSPPYPPSRTSDGASAVGAVVVSRLRMGEAQDGETEQVAATDPTGQKVTSQARLESLGARTGGALGLIFICVGISVM